MSLLDLFSRKWMNQFVCPASRLVMEELGLENCTRKYDVMVKRRPTHGQRGEGLMDVQQTWQMLTF